MSAVVTSDAAPSAIPRDAIDPAAAARELHARFPVSDPEHLRVDLFAAACGAYVMWRDGGAADARVVRAGGIAYLCIAREAMGTPRGRFSIAHELGHHVLHADLDAIARVHGGARSEGREFKIEREADLFASELLMPAALFAAWCGGELPCADDVRRAARVFRTSLAATARRFALLAPSACAYVEARGDRIVRVQRSAAFRGGAVQRRSLAESRASAWAAGRAAVVVREELLTETEETTSLWLAHALHADPRRSA